MIPINVCAHRFLKFDGYGIYARSLLYAMLQSGDFDIRSISVVEMHDLPGWMQTAAGIDHSQLTLSVMPAHELRNIPARQWLYSMYEAETLPDGWGEHVNAKAERLLVPCAWAARVFKDNGVQVPIHIIPGGVDVDTCALLPEVSRGTRPYTFMALADRGDRKGWDIVNAAFADAFCPNDDVALVVKARNPDFLKQFPRAGVRDAMSRKVRYWVGDVDNVRDVFAHADCVVYPARADGWGLFPREAAACGLPAIVTNYSGTANCEPWAYPLNDYVLASSSLPPPRGGGKWAKVRIDEVAHWMRYAYDHQDEARHKGLEAAAWLRAHQTWRHSVEALKALITEIDVTQPAALQAQWAQDEQLFSQDALRLVARIAEQVSAQEQ